MLNETWRVLQALEQTGKTFEVPHPLIQPLPSAEKNLLRVRLNAAGCVVAVEEVLVEERSVIRRIVRSSDGSFPVIKVNQPFLTLPFESTIWEKLSKTRGDQARIALLAEVVTQACYRTWKNAGWQWAVSLSKATLLADKLTDSDQAKGLRELCCRFKKALENDNKFISDVGQTALKFLQMGKLSAVKPVQELLVGKGKDGKGKDKKISVLLDLELDDNETVHRKISWELVSRVLPTNLAAAQKDYRHSATVSAFGGDEALLEEPFPAVKLPVLAARFPLISMASSADKPKCNKRYGLTEYTVFPVTSDQTRRMAGALEWLVTNRRRGITWQSMPSGKYEVDPRTHRKKEKPDLLLVYVEEKPDLAAKTASYFGSGRDITQAQFDVDAKAVCDALRGIVQVKPKSRLNLFLIRKVSDGQIQIALAESPFVTDVLDGAEAWQAGARNIPAVALYLPEEKFGKDKLPAVIDAQPQTPYPDQVVRLMSRQWVRDGASPKGRDGKHQKAAQEIVGPGLADILTVMLRTEGKWRSTAQQMLALLVGRVEPLLVGVFGAQHAYGPRQAVSHHEPLFDYPRRSREAALRAIAVFGILLDALGFKKEAYMKQAPFQIGQVLALADTLHKDYCVVVRRGQLPNTLIGTSLMRRALDNPAGALADLSERMMEYLRWAKIAQLSQEWANEDQRRIAVNEARKKLRQYQTLADRLGNATLPTESDDIAKAQLLLGFLSAPPEDQNLDEEEEKR